jgi:ATP-dependent Clp protease, protease subunit
MYRDRTMMINTFIDDQAANNIISIMLYLRNESPRDKISMYFNVPGAQLRPALAIYDLIQNTKKNAQIETVNLALCAGMGAILCASGTKGKRSAMPNARFLLHRTGMDQVFQGQATDIALEVKNVKLWNDRMENELSLLTGQKLDTIQSDLKREFYLIADEAVQYGLIDRVLLPSARKRAARGQEADLGTFEGELKQQYQNRQSNSDSGGWGSRSNGQQQQSNGGNNNDNNEPKVAKG